LTGATQVEADVKRRSRTFVAMLALGGWLLAGASVVKDPVTPFAVPDAPLPPYLIPQTLPPFGTTITRITGDPGTAIPVIGGTWGADARHHYSKDEPWNADQTLIALQNAGPGGFPKRLYLDSKTYQPRYAPCPNYHVGDDRWHPLRTHANERINVDGTHLEWFDVTTCKETRSWTLPLAADYFGMTEGNPSFDGRFVVLGDATRMFVVDMDPQPPERPYPAPRIGPVVSLNACGLPKCKATWLSISPSGKYAVVHYPGEAIQVWDVDPVTLALMPRAITQFYDGCRGSPAKGFIYSLGHADMTLNPFDHDEDVVVGQEKCGNKGRTMAGKAIGGVVMSRLRDGAMAPLTDPRNEAYPHHVSARSYDRRGWVYVSYFAERPAKKYNDEVVAVKLDGSGSVERLAHQRSLTPHCYRCETHAVPSRDGSRVIFASDWALNCGGRCGTQAVISGYVVATGSAGGRNEVGGTAGGGVSSRSLPR